MTMRHISHVRGSNEPPLLEKTVGELFDGAVGEHGGATALIVPPQSCRLSWNELDERVRKLGAGLLASGLEPGDRVGILAPNCVEWIVVQYATAKAGLVLVNINPASRRPELQFALARVGCKALVTASSFKKSDYLAMLGEIAPEITRDAPGKLDAAALPDLRLLITLDETDLSAAVTFAEIARRGEHEELQVQLAAVAASLDSHDPINIQYTSGTTGTPKPATLTHHNIVNNAWLSGSALRLGPNDRLCIPVPMYHCFGMVLGSLACVAHGATIVLPCAGFDAGAVLDAIEAESCTAIHGVPTMFIAALEHGTFAGRSLDSLRTGIMAGAPCPIELMKRVVRDMHLDEITIAYGMTETGPVSFQTSVADPLERRVTTVGRVLPHTEARIIDEDGNTVPLDTRGELLTRGFGVMKEYWGDEQTTRDAIDDDGWMHTGDLATLDEEGYCRIVGRTKDMIIRGGENIYPREIEEKLYEHEAVAEAAVFGVADDRFGEEVAAWIELHEGSSVTDGEIREFLAVHLAHFKVPRYIRFVDSFPMTVTGKVQKFKMRAAMEAELRLVARDQP